ncbi:hypothetical protein M2302_004002 [Micromonospora sp. A200]|uniref:hypothetical protein n=1 Tax=Micromonospora sp. A200 TaxID=2940568 RepID=UPI002472EAD3|nr:hypothetical protein [Micromonospora sp. A200]MDH6463805.1 hypothetical protein [Micromonospora sp. A200]
MTNVDVLEVDAMARARGQLTDAGRLLMTGLAWLLYAAGWSVARLCRVVAVTVGGLLYAVGWLAGRATTGGRWVGAAVAVGWSDGRANRRAMVPICRSPGVDDAAVHDRR